MLFPVALNVFLQQRPTAECRKVSVYIGEEQRRSVFLSKVGCSPEGAIYQHRIEMNVDAILRGEGFVAAGDMVNTMDVFFYPSAFRATAPIERISECSPMNGSASAGASQTNIAMFAPIVDYRPLLPTEFLAANHTLPDPVLELAEW
jgi:hypothetical protein